MLTSFLCWKCSCENSQRLLEYCLRFLTLPALPPSLRHTDLCVSIWPWRSRCAGLVLQEGSVHFHFPGSHHLNIWPEAMVCLLLGVMSRFLSPFVRHSSPPQAFPPVPEERKPNSRLQERLLKKLGQHAHPFYFTVSPTEKTSISEVKDHVVCVCGEMFCYKNARSCCYGLLVVMWCKPRSQQVIATKAVCWSFIRQTCVSVLSSGYRCCFSLCRFLRTSHVQSLYSPARRTPGR